ncbi:RpiB/LacA/LacB family sugar-phosphate isomerase [Patescibacteria group bacterium]|nr:RpiB/LacA/LacB family sugar-phosphate isomerase [Patescibacteria group bacterium]
MKIYIGSDHAGFALKQHLVSYLAKKGNQVIDTGPQEFNKDDDYPDLISLVAKQVSQDLDGSVGIIIGHSGQGEALVANKFKGIRAGVYYGGPEEILTLLKEHNNANVLSLGAHFLTEHEAEKAVDVWLDTAFSAEERHVRRIEKIKKFD